MSDSELEAAFKAFGPFAKVPNAKGLKSSHVTKFFKDAGLLNLKKTKTNPNPLTSNDLDIAFSKKKNQRIR